MRAIISTGATGEIAQRRLARALHCVSITAALVTGFSVASCSDEKRLHSMALRNVPQVAEFKKVFPNCRCSVEHHEMDAVPWFVMCKGSLYGRYVISMTTRLHLDPEKRNITGNSRTTFVLASMDQSAEPMLKSFGETEWTAIVARPGDVDKVLSVSLERGKPLPDIEQRLAAEPRFVAP